MRPKITRDQRREARERIACTAIHEAAHAVAVVIFNQELVRVTVRQSPHFLGRCYYRSWKSTRSELLGDLVVCMAGLAAECVCFGASEYALAGSEGDGSDAFLILEKLWELHRGKKLEYFLFDLAALRRGDDERAIARDPDKLAFMKEVNERVAQVVGRFTRWCRPWIEALAGALLDRPVLHASDVAKILAANGLNKHQARYSQESWMGALELALQGVE